MATLSDELLAQTHKDSVWNQEDSIDALALRLIREETGVNNRKRNLEYHDLDALAGTWIPEDGVAFQMQHCYLELLIMKCRSKEDAEV